MFWLIICVVSSLPMLPNSRTASVVSLLTLSAVDHGFEPWSCQTKDYKIGICCFSAEHAALRSKSKDWSARNQNNEWSDMSVRRLVLVS